jgi:hypothetical protein
MLLLWMGCTATTPKDSVVQTPTCTLPTSLEKVQEILDDRLPQVESHDHTMQGIALGDLDGDGWLDALMAYGGGSVGFRNDGAGTLVMDPSMTMDGSPLPSAMAVALADLDGDGDLDAYLGRDRGYSGLILYNDGAGHFSSVVLPDSAQAASTGAFFDADGDGDLDLYVGATTTTTDATQVVNGTVTRGDGDRLFIRQADGTYHNETDSRIPSDSDWGWTFQGSPLDFDGDGDMDLYLAHDMGAYMIPNVLLENDGTGHFTRKKDCDCELVMYGMGAAVGDANNDGRPDLYITDIGGPNLLINLGDGTFADATEAVGAEVPPTEDHLTSWGVTFTDLNLDSWPDIAMVFGQLGQPEVVPSLAGTNPDWVDGSDQKDLVLMSGPDGTYAEAENAWPEGHTERSLAVGDLDRDGVPDLVTVGKYLFRQWHTENSCGPAVRVLLQGPGLNPQALGARVDVQLGGRTVTQWALPSTTGSSSAPELYFGLGGLSQLDGGTVTWPDGSTTDFGPAAGGETVELSP